MPPVTERVIAGRYNLVETIGRGAMGVVWRARDSLLDRDVAIKEVVLNGPIGDEERENAYRRTMREARTAARLSHHGVVTIYDVAEEDGRPWIIMELVPSRSLDQMLSSNGPLPPRRACRIGQQLLAALATAHAAGVLHRDVKPSNVLIANDPDGDRAVLTDFGIAQFAGDPRLTQTGMVMGSPGFTAPERIRGGSATPASDLWSLGATLYAAVQGRGPYAKRGGPITTMSAIINEDAPLASSAGPLAPVIAALLRRDPIARPSAATASRMFAGVLPMLPDVPAPARRMPMSPAFPVRAPSAAAATSQDAVAVPGMAPGGMPRGDASPDGTVVDIAATAEDEPPAESEAPGEAAGDQPADVQATPSRAPEDGADDTADDENGTADDAADVPAVEKATETGNDTGTQPDTAGEPADADAPGGQPADTEPASQAEPASDAESASDAEPASDAARGNGASEDEAAAEDPAAADAMAADEGPEAAETATPPSSAGSAELAGNALSLAPELAAEAAAPAQASDEAQASAQTPTPAQTPIQAQTQAQGKTPAQAQTSTPVQTPTPAKEAALAPTHVPATTRAHAPTHAPASTRAPASVPTALDTPLVAPLWDWGQKRDAGESAWSVPNNQKWELRTKPQPSVGPAPQPRPRRWRLLAVAAVIVLAAAIGAAIALMSRHTPVASGSTGGSTGGATTVSSPPGSVQAIDSPVTALPPGWSTETVTPARFGTAGGFSIGVPPGWTERQSHLATYLEAPGDPRFMEIDLTRHDRSDMLSEAEYVEKSAIAQGHLPGYHRVSLQAVTVKGTSGAFWAFTWVKPGGVTMRVDDLLFELNTPSGPQSYAVYFTAPQTTFGTSAGLTLFERMLRTFTPSSG